MNAQSASYAPPHPALSPSGGRGIRMAPSPSRGRGNPVKGRGEGAPRIRAWSELGHVPGEDVGELVQEILGGELAHQRLLEERHALRVDLAAPAGVGQVRAD